MLRRFVCVPLFAALALAARADEGRIPIVAPTSIETPGVYMLTRDIAAAQGDGIHILASGVTLDLNGHTLAVAGASAVGIGVAGGVGDVTIRNGRITGGAVGITAAPTGGRVWIEGVQVSHPASHGIQASGTGAVEVRSCAIDGPGVDGIHVEATGALTVRLNDNNVTGAGRHGLYASGVRGGELRRNLVSGHAGSGIQLDAGEAGESGGAQIEDNIIRDGSIGIALGAWSSHNVVAGNVVAGQAAQGIVVSSYGNRIVDNEISDNGTYGLNVTGGYNVIEGNHICGNGYGLYMTCTGSKYRNNSLGGNTTLYCTGNCCTTANAGGNLF